MFLKLFPVYFLWFLCLKMDMYTAVKVEIIPKTFSKLEGTTVDVKCTLNKAETDAREVLLLTISRKGDRAIVLLHQNNSLSYSAGNAQEFPAKGRIARDIKSSSLQMTIKTPDKEDSGIYTCNVIYTDKQGMLKNHKSSDYLTIEDSSLWQMSETLKKLQAKLARGKQDIVDMKQEDTEDTAQMANLDVKLNKQNTDLQILVNKDTDVDRKLNEIQQDITTQIKNIQDANGDAADRTKVIEIENTSQHQAETIRDLTLKLSEFEKKVQSLATDIKSKEDMGSTTNNNNHIDESTKNDILNLKEKVVSHTKKLNDISDEADLNGDGITKLNGILKVMVDNIHDNEKKVSEFEKKVQALKEETDKKIDDLSKQKEDDLGNEFVNLQSTVKEQSKKIQEIADKAKEAKEMTKSMKGLTDALAKQIKQIETEETSRKARVAFHVTTGDRSFHPTQDESIKFGNVILNEGQGYDKGTGIFTAPKTGIYAFILYLQVPCLECKIEVTLVADNHVLSRYTGGSRYDPDQHSVSAAAKLEKGSKVTPYVYYLNKDSKGNIWNLGYLQKSGFSGWLVVAP